MGLDISHPITLCLCLISLLELSTRWLQENKSYNFASYLLYSQVWSPLDMLWIAMNVHQSMMRRVQMNTLEAIPTRKHALLTPDVPS